MSLSGVMLVAMDKNGASFGYLTIYILFDADTGGLLSANSKCFDKGSCFG